MTAALDLRRSVRGLRRGLGSRPAPAAALPWLCDLHAYRSHLDGALIVEIDTRGADTPAVALSVYRVGGPHLERLAAVACGGASSLPAALPPDGQFDDRGGQADLADPIGRISARLCLDWYGEHEACQATVALRGSWRGEPAEIPHHRALCTMSELAAGPRFPAMRVYLDEDLLLAAGETPDGEDDLHQGRHAVSLLAADRRDR